MKKARFLSIVILCLNALIGCTNEEQKGHVHHYSEFVSDTATCEEPGIKTFKCYACDETITEESPATGHDYKQVSTTATCTEKGVSTFKCSKCEKTKEEEQEALGHQYNPDTGTCLRLSLIHI